MSISESILLLLVWCVSISTAQLDYSPCSYKNNNQVECFDVNASQVLEAFFRNGNNSHIKTIEMQYVQDLNADILQEIFDVVASSAAENVLSIYLLGDQFGRIPESIRKFTNLRSFRVLSSFEFKILPAGSLVFSSASLQGITFYHTFLEEIQPGAFQGNFNGTFITLYFNRLKRFDQDVFKPLLSGSTVSIDVRENQIRCDCDLAWLVRHNRHLMSRVIGDCLDRQYQRISFEKVDVDTLRNC